MSLSLTNILGNTKLIKQDRGDLIEFDIAQLDFAPKRIFVVNKVPDNSRRGFHAHRNTRQCLVVIEGSIDVTLDTGKNKVYCTLNKGDFIHQEPLQWAEFVFRNNASLLVACSTHHDEEDYIRDYDEFKKLIGEKC